MLHVALSALNIIKLIVVAALVVFLAIRYRARAAEIAKQASPVEMPAAPTEPSTTKEPSRRQQKKASEKAPSTRLQRVRPRMRVPIPESADAVEPLADMPPDAAPHTAAGDSTQHANAPGDIATPVADGDNSITLDAIVPASGWPDRVSFKNAAVEVSTDDTDEMDVDETAAVGADAGWAEIDMNEVGMDDALVTMPSTPPAQEWAEDDGFDPASGWSDDPSSTDTSWSSGGSGDTPPRDEAEWADDEAHDLEPAADTPAWDMLNAQAWNQDEPALEAKPDDDQEPSWDVSDWATPESEAISAAEVEMPDTSETTQDIPVIASAIDGGLPTLASDETAVDADADAHGADATSNDEPHPSEPVADAIETATFGETGDDPIASTTDEIAATMPPLAMPVDEAPVEEPIVDEPTVEEAVAEQDVVDVPVEETPVFEEVAEEMVAAADVDEPVSSASFDAPTFEAPVALEPTPLAPFTALPLSEEQFAIAHFDDTPASAPIEVPSIELATNHVTWEVEEPDPLAPAPISQEWAAPAIEMESDDESRNVLPVSTDPTAPVIMYLQSGEQEMKVVIERDHTGNPLAWVLSGVAKVDAEGSAIRVRIPSPDADDESRSVDAGSHAPVEADASPAVGDETVGETFDVVVEVHATDAPQVAETEISDDDVAAETVDDADVADAEAADVAAADPVVHEPHTAGLGALAFDDEGLSPIDQSDEVAAPVHAVEVAPEPEEVAVPVVEDVVAAPVAPPDAAAMDPMVVALLDRLADTERALVELSTRGSDDAKPSSKKPKRKSARKRARAGASAQMHGVYDDDVPDMTPNEESRRKGDAGRHAERSARPAPGTAAQAIMTEPAVADRDTDAPAPRDTRPRPKRRDEREPRATVDTRTPPKPMPVMVDADNPLDIAALVQAEANRRVAEVLAQHGSVKTNGDFSGLVDRLEHVLDDDARSKA